MSMVYDNTNISNLGLPNLRVRCPLVFTVYYPRHLRSPLLYMGDVFAKILGLQTQKNQSRSPSL